MKDTAEGLLRELALHLQHDAGLTAQPFVGRRVGCLNLSLDEGALWRRIVDCIGGVPEPAEPQVRAIKARAEAADDVDPRVDESCGYLGGGPV